MSEFDQSSKPENIVTDIIGKKIFLSDISGQLIDAVRVLGATQRPLGDELVWIIECADLDELTKRLIELNHLGFLFAGGPAGWPAADVFGEFLARRNLSAKFKEIRWRSPSDWFIIER